MLLVEYFITLALFAPEPTVGTVKLTSYHLWFIYLFIYYLFAAFQLLVGKKTTMFLNSFSVLCIRSETPVSLKTPRGFAFSTANNKTSRSGVVYWHVQWERRSACAKFISERFTMNWKSPLPHTHTHTADLSHEQQFFKAGLEHVFYCVLWVKNHKILYIKTYFRADMQTHVFP